MKKRIIAVGAGAILTTAIIVSTLYSDPPVEDVVLEHAEFDSQLAHQEMVSISEAVMNALADYEIIGDIQINYQESISITTSEDQSIAEEMQNEILQALNSEGLSSVANINTYDIIIKSEVYEK
ncbi:hypothetical protein M3689_08205 [Alkalihalophilus marmarensis]|uniref:Uncharacterized protein n=1 Tax=Alkalihalophilus marmarensis DSM 21297 TaxID=1188261 RepID=U6STW9_9BACI|nr:hypothetical protein [Alkalihalophilus marmarensis]ERN55083.1 hypothetical protein A33I_03845 [Alkalihalophilus marmarensis DSM 21297]MCM3489279.1 hypothetical protein [Alkalihalophilus marmarensis]